MQFDTLPQSDHPLVAMRPIEATDLPTWANYLNLPSVYEHTSWNRPTVEDLGSYVWHEAMRTPSSVLRLAVALRSSNELVGTIGFHTVNPANQSAELAYDLSPSIWRHGIATHLCRLVVRWAHTNAAVIRVQATVLESNARSLQVLERAGFAREGLLQCYRIVRGTPRHFYMYSHVSLPESAT